MTTNIKKFQKDLKIKFKKKTLLIKALTHKSANSEYNNEKLEFLGDRVIGLILSKKLLDLYPKENEGVLDKRFARLVNRQICCDVGWSIKIQDYIIIGNKKKKITKSDEKIISDCCEALIGAIYLDKGFSTVEKIILGLWEKKIKESIITEIDAKTKLQEFSLKKFKKLPSYKLISNTGPSHKPVFKVAVKLHNSKYYIAEGSSKKDAEQNAAILCLNNNFDK